MPLIFSYGTLQEAPVQLSTFGRILEGVPDRLVGYERVILTFTDSGLIAASGKAVLSNLECSGSSESQVSGTCLAVTDSELENCDGYEQLANYRRQLITLESGTRAWVYTFAGATIG
jgi:hypothetical protein